MSNEFSTKHEKDIRTTENNTKRNIKIITNLNTKQFPEDFFVAKDRPIKSGSGRVRSNHNSPSFGLFLVNNKRSSCKSSEGTSKKPFKKPFSQRCEIEMIPEEDEEKNRTLYESSKNINDSSHKILSSAKFNENEEKTPENLDSLKGVVWNQIQGVRQNIVKKINNVSEVKANDESQPKPLVYGFQNRHASFRSPMKVDHPHNPQTIFRPKIQQNTTLKKIVSDFPSNKQGIKNQTKPNDLKMNIEKYNDKNLKPSMTGIKSTRSNQPKFLDPISTNRLSKLKTKKNLNSDIKQVLEDCDDHKQDPYIRMKIKDITQNLNDIKNILNEKKKKISSAPSNGYESYFSIKKKHVNLPKIGKLPSEVKSVVTLK